MYYYVQSARKIRLMLDWIIFVLGQLYNQICNTFALYIFSPLHNKALHSHERDTTFSLLFICLGLDAFSPRRVSPKQESSRFRNQVALPIRLYPVCIRNSFLNSRWEIVLYFPLLDFHPILFYTNSLDPRAYKLSLTQCTGI